MTNSPVKARIRLRHDVVYAKTRDGVLVRHSDGGFTIRGQAIYQWLTTVSPFLDGTLTEDELTAGLDVAHATMVRKLIASLRERGVVAEVSGRQIDDDDELAPYRSQIAYIDHYGGEGVERFERFRNARVMVSGNGPVAEAVRVGLEANGLRSFVERSGNAEESLDFVVICAEDGDFSRHSAEFIENAQSVLPVIRWGNHVVLGPLTGATGGETGWQTAMSRLTRNGDSSESVAFWRSIALDRSMRGGVSMTPAHASMIGLMVAYEIFRALTGALSPETKDGVLCFDLVTGDTDHERILPDPLDQNHTAFPLENVMSLDLVQDPTQEEDSSHTVRSMHSQDGPGDGILSDRRTDAERGEMERYLRLVGRLAGVITGFDDEEIEQSPVKVAVARLAHDGGPLAVAGYSVETLGDARRDSIEHAVLEYISQLGPIPRKYEGGARRIAPNTIATWTGFIPESNTEAIGEWVSGWTLGGDRVEVPVAAVYPRSSVNGLGAFEHTSAGEGIGPTINQAIICALRSAFEFEALNAAVRGGALRQIPDLCTHPTATYLIDAARAQGLDLEAVLFPAIGPEPVAFVRESEGVQYALASGHTIGDAVANALLRLHSRNQVKGTLLSHDQLLLPDFDPRTLDLGSAASPDPTDPSDKPFDWRSAVAGSGYSVTLVDITPKDIASIEVLRAVRAIISRIAR